MRLRIWQVDAFSAQRFGGNPAAVVPLTAWLPDEQLRAIAAENNLSETAYLLAEGGQYHIRWFTPTEEVPLCGHATLASAWVVLERLEPGCERVTFNSLSGELTVQRQGQRLVMDFPIGQLDALSDWASDARARAVVAALGVQPRELHVGFQWLALYDSEASVRALAPDMKALVETGIHGVIVTAPGEASDFVSRFFAPAAGVPEDPVTGSAHTRLTPFWAARLGKSELYARQVSARGGELWCRLAGHRVHLAGQVAPYLEGTIEV